MTPQLYNLAWESHVDYFRSMLFEMKKTNMFTDVTLVCDDQIQIQAHRIILSAGSSVFSQIIGNLPQNDPVIFLRGIQHQEMESLLEFLYLGQTNIGQERLEEFFNVSKSLDIKEISNAEDYQSKEGKKRKDKSIGNNLDEDLSVTVNSSALHDNEDEICNSVDYQSRETKKRRKLLKKNDHEEELTHTVNFSVLTENEYDDKLSKTFKTEKSKSFKHNPQKKLNECPQCDYKSAKASRIRKHVESKHDGVTFGCDKCELSFSNTSNLRKHIRVVHLGMKFNCSECDYKNGQKVNLQNHMKSKHNILYKD